MLRKLYKLDHLYGLLLTFGIALIIEGIFRDQFGISGQSYDVPELLSGGVNLGFMFLPIYRGWIIVAAHGVLRHLVHVIERPSSAPICGPAPRTRRWCRRWASTCRC